MKGLALDAATLVVFSIFDKPEGQVARLLPWVASGAAVLVMEVPKANCWLFFKY
jgi:hypothetical protein